MTLSPPPTCVEAGVTPRSKLGVGRVQDQDLVYSPGPGEGTPSTHLEYILEVSISHQATQNDQVAVLRSRPASKNVHHHGGIVLGIGLGNHAGIPLYRNQQLVQQQLG